MKHLKLYEYYSVPADDEYFKVGDTYISRKKFWLINCKDEAYYIASLYHIKIKKDAIASFLKRRDYIIEKYNDEKFYMTISGGYMNFSEGYSWYTGGGLDFMGEIIPTQKEIEKAELELTIKKYNL